MVAESNLGNIADPQVARAGLLDVLTFLERRGASIEVMELAMRRAGIREDVARLLSRCTERGAAPPNSSLIPQLAIQRSGRVAERALGRIASGVWMLVLVFGAGVGVGVAVGYEVGLELGFETGLDRLAVLLAG